MNEDEGGVLVCAIVDSGILERAVMFTLSTQDESATSTSPRDFSATTMELTLDQDVSTACANISIEDDSVVEDLEIFQVMIGGDDSSVNFLAPTSATVTIVDNDMATIGFEMDHYRGEEGQTVEVCVVVKGDVALERAVMVRLSTTNFTAAGLTITLMIVGC